MVCLVQGACLVRAKVGISDEERKVNEEQAQRLFCALGLFVAIVLVGLEHHITWWIRGIQNCLALAMGPLRQSILRGVICVRDAIGREILASVGPFPPDSFEPAGSSDVFEGAL